MYSSIFPRKLVLYLFGLGPLISSRCFDSVSKASFRTHLGEATITLEDEVESFPTRFDNFTEVEQTE